MATGYFFKTSADAGAPPLRNVAGDLIAVLDWALLSTGFWSKVYSGTNKAVYRATTGNRYYLWVDDSAITTAAAVRGYNTMTGLDTGTGMFPDTGQHATNAYYALRSSSGTARSYRIVGDCTFFALMSHYDGSANYSAPFFFGDVNPLDGADTFATMIYASHSTTMTNTAGGATFALSTDYANNQNRVYWARGLNGINTAHDGNMWTGVPNANGSAIALTAVPFFQQVRIGDHNRSGNSTTGYCRAALPYVYAMPYAVDTGVLPMGTVLNLGGSTWQAQGSCSNGFYTMLRMSNDEPGRP